MVTSCTSVLMFNSTRFSSKFSCLLLFFIAICAVQLQAQENRGQSVNKSLRDPFDFRVNPQRLKNIEFEGAQTTSFSAVDNRLIDSLFHLDKNYDFEFRCWSRYLFMNFNNVFIMRFSNNAWTARYFDLKESNGNPKKFTERKVDQSKVNQLWSKLVEHKVLTLPDMNDLQPLMVNYQIDTAALQISGRSMHMTDGVLYCFELLTPTKKRHYKYANPESSLKLYGNIEALAMAQMNILLIQKFLGKAVSK